MLLTLGSLCLVFSEFFEAHEGLAHFIVFHTHAFRTYGVFVLGYAAGKQWGSSIYWAIVFFFLNPYVNICGVHVTNFLSLLLRPS